MWWCRALLARQFRRCGGSGIGDERIEDARRGGAGHRRQRAGVGRLKRMPDAEEMDIGDDGRPRAGARETGVAHGKLAGTVPRRKEDDHVFLEAGMVGCIHRSSALGRRLHASMEPREARP